MRASRSCGTARFSTQNVILLLIPDVVLGAGEAMRRREFIILLGSAAVVWPLAVTAQSPSRVYRVGSLITGTPIADDSPSGAALIRGLAEHGYVLNRNLMFEHRGAEMQLDRLPRLVDELVTSKKVDVIVAFGYPSRLIFCTIPLGVLAGAKTPCHESTT